MDRSSRCRGILSWLQGCLYKGLSLQRKDWRMILLESHALGILQKACFSGSWVWKVPCLPLAFIQAVRSQQVILVDALKPLGSSEHIRLGPQCLEKFIGKLWPSNASLRKDLPGQEVTPLCSHLSSNTTSSQSCLVCEERSDWATVRHFWGLWFELYGVLKISASTEVVWASVVPSFKPVVCQASWKMMQRRKGWRTGREEKLFPFFGHYSDKHFWSNYCGTWLRREEKGTALFLSS